MHGFHTAVAGPCLTAVMQACSFQAVPFNESMPVCADPTCTPHQLTLSPSLCVLYCSCAFHLQDTSLSYTVISNFFLRGVFHFIASVFQACSSLCLLCLIGSQNLYHNEVINQIILINFQNFLMEMHNA